MVDAKVGKLLGNISRRLHLPLPGHTNANAQRTPVQCFVALRLILAFGANWHFLLRQLARMDVGFAEIIEIEVLGLQTRLLGKRLQNQNARIAQ